MAELEECCLMLPLTAKTDNPKRQIAYNLPLGVAVIRLLLNHDKTRKEVIDLFKPNIFAPRSEKALVHSRLSKLKCIFMARYPLAQVGGQMVSLLV